MNELEKLFAMKQTENGDKAYNTTGNNLLDILFMTAYFEKHLNEVSIGRSYKEQIFSMFIRDPRFGLGRRYLGREMMKQSKLDYPNIVKVGRYDDLMCLADIQAWEWWINKAKEGDELAKKWLPRLCGKDSAMIKVVLKELGISEKEYRKIIKCDTVENKLSHHRINEISFEHVPSLAMLKYYKIFLKEPRFKEYLESVKKGEKKLNVSTTTVYDIYKNRDKIDPDLFFDKIEKINISCVPVLDTSGSMWDSNDSIGKAMSIAHYLAKCTTFCNNHVVSFSNRPQLIKLGEPLNSRALWNGNQFAGDSNYHKEINSMYTGDCSNTDLGKVMELFAKMESTPEYLVILSDMEFDRGSYYRKETLMKLWKEKGYTTKIVWWNFNNRNKTVPELDEHGNIYLSGYSPYLLKYLEAGFNGEKFLNKLLAEYAKNIEVYPF